MRTPFRMGLLAFVLSFGPLAAQPVMCNGAGCDTVPFKLMSVSAHANYAVLVLSPAEIGCNAVHFVVRDRIGAVLGRSQPLMAGEMQVVRIGRGYAAGPHPLQINASGCPVQPEMLRLVRLGKTSPDHGWRAAAFLQAQFVP